MLAGNMPAAFQVLLNVRVLWTGVMFYFLMGRVLTKKQWLALFVLCGGAVCTQLDVRTRVHRTLCVRGAVAGLTV